MCFVTVNDEEPMPIRTTKIKRSSSPRAQQYSSRSMMEKTEMREERGPPTVRAPSVRAPSRVSRAPTRVTRAASRPRSTTRSAYVEVDRESSVSSGSSDKKSRRPFSEYSMHEREYRREVARQPEYETYRYVEPREDHRRTSRDARRAVDENIRISMTRERR